MEYTKWFAHIMPPHGGSDLTVSVEAPTADQAKRVVLAQYPGWTLLSLRPA